MSLGHLQVWVGHSEPEDVRCQVDGAVVACASDSFRWAALTLRPDEASGTMMPTTNLE